MHSEGISMPKNVFADRVWVWVETQTQLGELAVLPQTPSWWGTPTPPRH